MFGLLVKLFSILAFSIINSSIVSSIVSAFGSIGSLVYSNSIYSFIGLIVSINSIVSLLVSNYIFSNRLLYLVNYLISIFSYYHCLMG